jgi:predicted protein tyrosine phosphatase
MTDNGASLTANSRAKKRVLFVCTQNRVRSLTAQLLYRGRPDLEVQSAGISEYARVPLTQDLLEWADQVFVFSRRQQKVLEKRYGDFYRGKRIVCLNLPDRFEYNGPKLITKLTVRLGRYLGKPVNNEQAATDGPAAPTPESPPLKRIRLQLGRIAGWSMVCSVGAWLCHLLLGSSPLR